METGSKAIKSKLSINQTNKKLRGGIDRSAFVFNEKPFFCMPHAMRRSLRK